jgi:hypothetical protein
MSLQGRFMKTAELTGALLDYWVARALGMTHEQADFVVPAHSYSTNWSHGGPIIERERIMIVGGYGEEWGAIVGVYDPSCGFLLADE